MLPRSNLITFTARARGRIIALHGGIADAIEAQDGGAADAALVELAEYTVALARSVFEARAVKH